MNDPRCDHQRTEDVSEAIDLSKHRAAAARADKRPRHDGVGARTTGWLIALVAVLTIASYLAALTGVRTIDEIGKLHGLVVTPLLTIASVMIGFYFGQLRDP